MKWVAVPCYHVFCKVFIEKDRAWSVVDELLLWSLADNPKSIQALSDASNLPPQFVVASAYRLMRFRLIEAVVERQAVYLMASEYGRQLVRSGHELPRFPKRYSRNGRFVVERATGHSYAMHGLSLKTHKELQTLRGTADEHIVVDLNVVGGGPAMTHKANYERLAELLTRGSDEQIVKIDPHVYSLRDDQYVVYGVQGGTVLEQSGPIPDRLKRIILDTAESNQCSTTVTVAYSGKADDEPPQACYRDVEVREGDLVVGGPEHLSCLSNLADSAHRHLVILSTFFNFENVKTYVVPILRRACARGVTVNIVWGTDVDTSQHANHREVRKFQKYLRTDSALNGRVIVRMQPTGSHAKVLLADSLQGNWTAVVGSCNWLLSPFKRTEVSVQLRDQQVVADVMEALQNVLSQKALSDQLATDMAVLARGLRCNASLRGLAQAAVVAGDMHDSLLRQASGEAKHRFTIGCDKLGATYTPSAMLPARKAKSCGVENVRLYYSTATGPVTGAAARRYQLEADVEGIELTWLHKELHGKFLIWDSDNVVITSMNWMSASSNVEFPYSELGVHLKFKGIGDTLVAKLVGKLALFENDLDMHSPQAGEDQ